MPLKNYLMNIFESGSLERISSLQLFLLSFVPRVLLLLINLGLTDFNLDIIFSSSDANSYLLIAKNILTNARNTQPFDERAFPGWPLFFTPFSYIFGLKWACLSISLILSSLVPVLYYKLTNKPEISILLCFITPTFIMHSVNGMSEPLYLFAILTSIIVFGRKKIFWQL